MRPAGPDPDGFAAMLAHELRGSMGVMVNAIALAELNDDPAALQRAIAQMKRQLQKQEGIVEGVLLLERIRRGEQWLPKERLDLRHIIWNVLDDANRAMVEREHRLTMSFPDEPLWVRGHETWLEVAFGNLVKNAAKYTPASGRIAVLSNPESKSVCVRVRDTGVGIEPALLPRIFDWFVRGQHAHEMGRDGVGVGLALTRELVELHGGTIVAASKGKGLGAEFTVRLPRDPDPIE